MIYSKLEDNSKGFCCMGVLCDILWKRRRWLDWWDMQKTCKRKNLRLSCVSKHSCEFSEFCPNINAMHCSKEKIQSEKERLDRSWDSISNIPGTRGFHFFRKINENFIGLQAISADPYNYKIFDMKSGKFVTLLGTSDEQETNVSHEIVLSRLGEEEKAGAWSPLAFCYPRRVVSYRWSKK